MKPRNFFYLLSKNTVIVFFKDKSDRMLVNIPGVVVYKSHQNIWRIEIWVPEKLFNYTHLFIFTSRFNKKLSVDEFEILFGFVNIFSIKPRRKEFNIQPILVLLVYNNIYN